jgi:membrane protease YdiL (CAAX protease family)
LAFTAILLLLGLGSTAVWLIASTRRSAGLPMIPQVNVPPANWPALAVIMAAACVLLQTAGRVANEFQEAPAPPEVRHVTASLVLGGLIWLLLLATLLLGNSTPRESFGLSFQRWPAQLGWGAAGYLAAIGPTWLMLAATRPWRSVETQHEFLKLLADAPHWSTVALMLFTVAVVAPLSEELQYRVVLQGWLAERIGVPWAIAGVALVFALAHGWRDGLALLPLALILGYLFDRRRSYLAVVTAHALFNGVMFGLQWLSGIAE